MQDLNLLRYRTLEPLLKFLHMSFFQYQRGHCCGVQRIWNYRNKLLTILQLTVKTLSSFINFDKLLKLTDLVDLNSCFWNWSMNLLTLNIFLFWIELKNYLHFRSQCLAPLDFYLVNKNIENMNKIWNLSKSANPSYQMKSLRGLQIFSVLRPENN